MRFVFDAEYVFQPERDRFVMSRQHVKSCDFMWLQKTKKGQRLLLIEAKNSAPFQEDPLVTYLQEIHDKFCHSLLVYIPALFGRHSRKLENLTGAMNRRDILKKRIMLVLVVRQHKKEWLPLLQEALRKKTRGLKNAFSIQDVLVVNEEVALQRAFVSSQR